MDLMAIAFPFNDPVAIHLGPLAIRWYGLAYMAGLLLGWLYMRRLCADERLWGGPSPMRPEQADDFLFWATIGTVIGGRLGFFLFYEPGMLFSHPLQFFRIWEGGMAFHGGLLGVGLAVWLFARRNRIPVRSLMDLSAAAVPIGLFFGRIANFINGEIYGRLTDVPWAVEFPARVLAKGDLLGAAPPDAALRGGSRRRRDVFSPALLHAQPPVAPLAGTDNGRIPHGLWRVPHLRRVLQGMGHGAVLHDRLFLGGRRVLAAHDRARRLFCRHRQTASVSKTRGT